VTVRPPRIALDLRICQVEGGERGAGRYALSLARAIARRAEEGRVVVILDGRLPVTVPPLRRAFDGLLPAGGVVVSAGLRPETGPGPAGVWRRRAAERVRLGFLEGLRVDVAHVFSLCPHGAAEVPPLSGEGRGRFAVTATLSDIDLLQRASSSHGRPPEPHTSGLGGARQAELVLATSERARALAIATLGLPAERVVTVPPGAEERTPAGRPAQDGPEAPAARLGIDGPFLLAPADPDDLVTTMRLIQAFALLPGPVRESHHLTLLGELQDGMAGELRAAAARFGLRGDQVVVSSGVEGEDATALYAAAALVVVAGASECLGSSALAAMSNGAPVIAADIGGLPEVLDRADALFGPADQRAQAAMIHRALTDEDFLGSLREHGRHRARKFSWDSSADRALEAFADLCERRGAPAATTRRASAVATRRARPRLALVTPLSPERTGIADYSAELLPQLARHYEVDVVVRQASVEDPRVAAHATVRTASWFDAHAGDYDRIVYQFGNSPFHEHLFGLLARHGGVVVLHDFFLSGAVQELDATGGAPGAFGRALYASHGYPGLVDELRAGRAAAIWKYPCNKEALDRADGVIVHSSHALQLADDWYGAGCSGQWRRIPLLRSCPPAADRRAARERLGVSADDFLVCSVGHMGPSKLNDRLLDAWLASPLSGDRHCVLAFVGEAHDDEYSRDLARTAGSDCCGGRVRITGYASRSLYEDYLAGADVAVQLRALSRGETAASVLDCLARGVPTIANANGWVAELPEDVTVRLPDKFSQAELVEALVRLRDDPQARAELSRRGREHVRAEHDPRRAGDLYRDAIEEFAEAGTGSAYRRLVRDLRDIDAPAGPTTADLLEVAACVSANLPARPPRQILLDVTPLALSDHGTGIQRVSRAVLKALLERTPHGYRVEPVRDDGRRFVYARRFTLSLLGVGMTDPDDAPVATGPGDVFLALDLSLGSLARNREALAEMRSRGVGVFTVLYDLLPVLRPEVFSAAIGHAYREWLDVVTAVSDGVACISRTVADELVETLTQDPPDRRTPLRIGYFHLGADLVASLPSRGLEADAAAVIESVRSRPSVLMVGTVEPRKGHAQALSAFERLWSSGANVGLVIVGRRGWMTEALVARLRAHPERGRRLLWLEGASDEMLLTLYEASVALLAASEGEGFGLPLVEAAQHGLPIVARDLPVFREVAGDHAYYFSGLTADDLAAAISAWLDLWERGLAPASTGMPWLTWAESAGRLLDVIRGGHWYATWRPYGRHGAPGHVERVAVPVSRAAPEHVDIVAGPSG
jgi:glycosyltransferase involved in cell wall biosynthesis